MKRKRDEGAAPDADVKTSQRKDSSPSFANFGLDPRLLQALAQEGFSTPTPVQAKAIPLALEGKDVLARAKTGSGKTIAYLLPVLQSILRRKAEDSTVRAGISAIILVPTRELAQQVSQVVTALCECCTRAIRCVNLTQKVSDVVQRSQLAESPDILIATPGRLAQNLNRPELALEGLTHFVIDEADLVLSYGYEEDLQAVAKVVPKGVQMMLLSATLSTDIDTLTGLFCRNPAILELDEKDDDCDRMSQYVVKCAEEEKFLLTYVIFKLKLLKGKCIIFVSDVNRCYRLKLFLEQFGIRSCVLNSELPVNSRIHVVQEFNKNVYDIIIASDEHEAMGGKPVKPKRKSGDETQDGSREQVDPSAVALSSKKPNSTEEQQDDLPQQRSEEEQQDDLPQQGSEEEEQDEEDEAAPAKPPSKKPKSSKKAKEYGISRGIDFKNVACVLNFDLPTSSKSYTHRIGRTARAGNSGTALSFVIPTELYNKHKSTTIPSAINDEAVLAQITKHQQKKKRKKNGGRQGGKEEEEEEEQATIIQPYSFDMTQVEAFRYRMTDALRAVTRLAVHKARARELRRELLNSEKLKRYFEENPAELRHLQRHDAESHAVRVQPHLKHIPDYLMPAGAGSGAGVGAVSDSKSGNGVVTGTGIGTGTEIGFVPLRKPTDNRIRKARMMHRLKGGKNSGSGRNHRSGGGRGQKSSTVNNPLKSFKISGSRR